MWFKIDDDFWSHPKVRAAGPAVGLWALAGSYCGKHLTDGAVPSWLPGSLGYADDDVARLMAAGLWEATDDAAGPWVFHDWLDYNPSKATVQMRQRAERLNRALGRSKGLREAIKKRDGGACRFCGRKVNFSDGVNDSGGTYDHLIPTSQGGTNTLENVVVACRGCNIQKANRTPNEAGMSVLPPSSGTRKRAPRSAPSSAPRTLADEAPRSTPSSDLGLDPGTPGGTPGRVGFGSGAVPSAARQDQDPAHEHEEPPTRQRLTLVELTDHASLSASPAPEPGRLTTGTDLADLVLVPGSAALEAEGVAVTTDSGQETPR